MTWIRRRRSRWLNAIYIALGLGVFVAQAHLQHRFQLLPMYLMSFQFLIPCIIGLLGICGCWYYPSLRHNCVGVAGLLFAHGISSCALYPHAPIADFVFAIELVAWGAITVVLATQCVVVSTWRTVCDDSCPFCQDCGYLLARVTVGRCPECGSDIPDAQRELVGTPEFDGSACDRDRMIG